MKEIIIIIAKDEAERDKYFKKLSDETMQGIVHEGRRTILFTAKIFAKIFTPKRLELLMFLRQSETYSISNIAKKLNRRFEVVHRDLKLLAHYGFVKLLKKKNRVIPARCGKIKMPVIA